MTAIQRITGSWYGWLLSALVAAGAFQLLLLHIDWKRTSVKLAQQKACEIHESCFGYFEAVQHDQIPISFIFLACLIGFIICLVRKNILSTDEIFIKMFVLSSSLMVSVILSIIVYFYIFPNSIDEIEFLSSSESFVTNDLFDTLLMSVCFIVPFVLIGITYPKNSERVAND